MPEISVLRDRGIRRMFSSTPVGVGRITALTRSGQTQDAAWTKQQHRPPRASSGALQHVRFVDERDAFDNARPLENRVVALAAFQLADVVEGVAQRLDGRFD